MKFSLITGLGFIFSGISLVFPGFASDHYTPPDNGRQKTVAQGSRGCAAPQGELSLLAANPLTVGERDFSLTFYYDPPARQAPEVLLISLLHPKQPEPLFFQEIALNRAGPVKVPVSAALEPNLPYRLVAGLPCAGHKTNLKYLQITVEYVPSPTAAVRPSPAAD
jgi:hypothetical protein